MIPCSGKSGSLSAVGFRVSIELDNPDSGLETGVLKKTKVKP